MSAEILSNMMDPACQKSENGKKERQPALQSAVRDTKRERSELTDHKSVPAIAEHLVGGMVDVLADEADAAITQQELRSASMQRLEAHRRVPALMRLAT